MSKMTGRKEKRELNKAMKKEYKENKSERKSMGYKPLRGSEKKAKKNDIKEGLKFFGS